MTAINPPTSSSDLIGAKRIHSAHHRHHSCGSYDTMNCRDDVVLKSETWPSGLGLLKFSEFIIPVDQFAIWRRHLMLSSSHSAHDASYSIRSNTLKELVTQQYAYNMVSHAYNKTTKKGKSGKSF